MKDSAFREMLPFPPKDPFNCSTQLGPKYEDPTSGHRRGRGSYLLWEWFTFQLLRTCLSRQGYFALLFPPCHRTGEGISFSDKGSRRTL